MAPPRADWATAFLRQSRSDWDVFRILSSLPDVPQCHRLHYLQMACEKLAKAYRIRDTAADLADLLSRHVGFASFVRAYLRSTAVRFRFRGRQARLRELAQCASQIAGEIEKLAPAIDRVGRPENAEYPWADGERVVAPLDYSFPNVSLLRTPGGRAFLKIIEEASRAQ